MKKIWAVVAGIIILSVLFTTIHVNLVISDIRNVTKGMNIEDVRQFMDIVQTQQSLEGKK